jgi:hypothetical protein
MYKRIACLKTISFQNGKYSVLICQNGKFAKMERGILTI